MSTWQRLRYAFVSTVALAMGGIVYSEVFSESLMPVVDNDGMFSTPLIWLDRLAPVIIVGLLLAVWVWFIAGAVQDERTVDRRRVRR